MSFAVNVKGSTNPTFRKPRQPAYTIPWACGCESDPDGTAQYVAEKLNPGYLVRCIDCGVKRPDAGS